MRVILACAVLALAACGPSAPPPDMGRKPVNAATLKAETIPLREETDNAANVARVVHLAREGAKLYSLVGGDPAINGEYVTLGLFKHPEGWRTFRIGDFNSWELVSQTPDRVLLKVSHSAIDDATGEIVTAEQTIAIALPPPDAEPSTVQMTPVD